MSTGDGKADLVFPPEPGGTPLQIWTTGDNLEDRRYFLELYELDRGFGTFRLTRQNGMPT